MVNSSTARLTNVRLVDNQAARGAGIYVANSSLTLTGATLNTNSARNTGEWTHDACHAERTGHAICQTLVKSSLCPS